MYTPFLATCKVYPDSTLREIFAFGIGNTGHFCSWDPEYEKFLFVGSQAAQGHYVWVRASEVIWSEYTASQNGAIPHINRSIYSTEATSKSCLQLFIAVFLFCWKKKQKWWTHTKKPAIYGSGLRLGVANGIVKSETRRDAEILVRNSSPRLFGKKVSRLKKLKSNHEKTKLRDLS